MFTYQIRSWIFKCEFDKPLIFPAQCEVKFHFQPLQPFGLKADGGHTAVQNVASSTLFNANTGEHTIESNEPLKPLDVTIEEPIRIIRLTGNVLSVSQHIQTNRKLTEMINGLYFCMPLLLNITFGDPPYIERVDGNVGSNPFRWELSEWNMRYQITTQDKQESDVIKAWSRLEILSAPHRRRLIAGLHYYHVACRLARQGSTAGEFVAEVLLNLTKTLEVLFPPDGDGKTRDAARKALRQLGFTNAQIESDFIPAMCFRNKIDVCHVELGLFKMAHLKAIHEYTERAESAFHKLFEKLMLQIESKKFDVAPYTVGPVSQETLAIVEQLLKYD